MRVIGFLPMAVLAGLATVGVAVAGPAEEGTARSETGGAGMPAEVADLFAAHPVPAETYASAMARAAARPEAGGLPGFKSPSPERWASGRSPSPQQTYTWMIDNFETAILDPFLWTVSDLDDELFGEYIWGLSQCRSTGEGSQSLWGVGAGANGQNLGCQDLYPSGVNSSAIVTLDLNGFATPPGQLDLVFDFWLNTRIFEEYGVVPDGLFVNYLLRRPDNLTERVVLQAATSQHPERFFSDPITIDMLQATEVYEPFREFNLYDLAMAEQGFVLIEFLFMSRDPKSEEPAPSTFQGGAFVDNVRIISDVERQPVAPSARGDLPVLPARNLD